MCLCSMIYDLQRIKDYEFFTAKIWKFSVEKLKRNFSKKKNKKYENNIFGRKFGKI